PSNMVQVSVPVGSSVVVIRPAGVSGWYLTECSQCNWTIWSERLGTAHLLPMVVMQTYATNPRAQMVLLSSSTRWTVFIYFFTNPFLSFPSEARSPNSRSTFLLYFAAPTAPAAPASCLFLLF